MQPKIQAKKAYGPIDLCDYEATLSAMRQGVLTPSIPFYPSLPIADKK